MVGCIITLRYKEKVYFNSRTAHRLGTYMEPPPGATRISLLLLEITDNAISTTQRVTLTLEELGLGFDLVRYSLGASRPYSLGAG